MARSAHAVAATPPPPAWRRLAAGTSMLLLAAALTVPGVAPGGAAAQEFDDDLGGGAGGTTEEVEVTDIAFYAFPLTNAVPGTLRTGVPPAVVCVVAPQLCPEPTEPIRDILDEGLNSGLDAVPAEPLHPVPPGTLAVSILAGNDRYLSALRFEAPALPEGEEFISFELRIPVTQPSFDVNSPAFRRAVLGLFETVADPDNDPQLFFDGLEDALTNESALDLNDDIIGIEACPFTAAFDPNDPPQAQDAEEDLPRDEEFDEPEIDCLLGGSGQFDEDTEEFVFDLTFTGNAWGQGELENFGLLLQPTGVQNLAFGDPDTSTSAQIALSTEDLTVTFASQEPPPPPGGFDDDFDDGFGDDFAAEDGFEDGFDVPADDGGFQEMDGFEPGPAVGGPMDADGPDVAAPTEAPQAAPQEDGQQQAVVQTRRAGGEPIDPWWLWLLVPLFGGGGYLVAAPLLAPTAAGGTATPGAMSRLLARSGTGLAT